jgi:small subunit ribosomal protein S5
MPKEILEQEESLIDKVINVKRVTKVTKGGKRFAFSALVVSGNKKGMIGIGLGKSRDVSSAIAKATRKELKSMFDVSLRGTTLPYNVIGTHGASKVVVKSAYKGTGMIAGGAVRSVMEVVGVRDVLAKSLGSPNKRNVAKASLNALAKLRSASRIAALRGKTVSQVVWGEDVTTK